MNNVICDMVKRLSYIEINPQWTADIVPAFGAQTMHVSATTVLPARKSSTLREFTELPAAFTIKPTPEAAARGDFGNKRTSLQNRAR